MPKKKQILYPVVFMVCLTAFFTFLLAFVNDVTKETIELQQRLTVQRSILYVFDIDTANMDDNSVIDLFDKYITSDVVEDKNIYTYQDQNKIKGYAFDFVGKGLWGNISGHISFDPSYSEILGINFTVHSETPGLGGRIDESNFKEPFRHIELSGRDEFIAYRPNANGNIDAISGATLTSLAVKDLLNTSIPEIFEFAKKEGFYEGN